MNIKATVLSDNIACGGLAGEWGLSVYIEYGESRVLLDTGASTLFLENAVQLGLDIAAVDAAVLSHAHYDHADGMAAFFKANSCAKFWLRGNAKCYKKEKGRRGFKYIGVPEKILSKYNSRIAFAEGDVSILPGVTLVPHKTAGLSAVGEKNKMYVRCGRRYFADDFAHEQSLVFDMPDGLVVFNSCSHGGADVVINEIADTFPDKKVKALIGGFHLYDKSEAEVRALANRIRETGIEKIYTGHCTGEKAFAILREELGDIAGQLTVGLVMEF